MHPARTLRRLGARIGSFRHAREGSTAVEFAMVALPFLMLLCAVFEAGMLLLSQQMLSNAVDRAARSVFTGAFQEGFNGTPATDRFKAALCDGPTLFSCTSVKVEVTTSRTFAALAATDPYDPQTKAMSTTFGTKFQCPAGNDVVTVRAAVVVPRFFTFLDLSPRKIGAGGQLVVGTAIFRAEPYASGKC